ncbi:MAG TPA: hypothetical protein EYP62_05795 [Kiritimatiellae bacterium]|nr:hypothetical protein [Kiritimatiellia bacterium]
MRAFADVKDNCDSGQFKAIQHAACAAIAHRGLAEQIRLHYERRLHKLVGALRQAGFEARMPAGTFYVYVRAPGGAGRVTFDTAEEASQFLIRRWSVSSVPWDDAGAYLRFSATFEARDEGDEDRILEELVNRLRAAQLRF